MKTYRIQLDPVSEAMLHDVRKVKREYSDLQELVLNQIRHEYAMLPRRGKKLA